MLFDALLDVLFPPVCLHCGVSLRQRAVPELCSRCSVTLATLPDPLRCSDGVTACFAYDGPLAEAITRCKYGGDAALAGPLGRALATDPRWACDVDGHPWDVVTCIPMHRWRRLRRGFDHAALMLGHAQRARRSGVASGRVLQRVRNDPPQASLPATARRRNLVGAFVVRDGAAAIRGARVLVVDDVTTTGATLGEAARALRAAGAASVHGLALLRTLDA